MVHTSLKNRLKAIEDSKKVKRELPWDCKALFSQYQRGDVINTLAGRKELFRLMVDDTRGLSFEAREFLSLSAAGQARAIEQNTQVISEIEAEELRRDILERLFL
ncbi:MAG TPA: hypothetical protein VGK06_08320 [Methanosarcina sp.]|jgi:predicted RNA-binding protein